MDREIDACAREVWVVRQVTNVDHMAMVHSRME